MPNIILRSETTPATTVTLRRLLGIAGVTRIGAGTPLPSAAVHLFRSIDSLHIADAISDPVTGGYLFSVPGPEPYYVVSFKDYTVDDSLDTVDSALLTADMTVRSGVTANTLVGV